MTSSDPGPAGGGRRRSGGAGKVLKRIGIVYVLGSVFLTTLLLVLVGVNLIAPVLQMADARRRSDIAEASKARRLESYEGFTMEQLETLLDETWKRPYVYAPWVGFREEPRTGEYVNVSEEGYRACPGTERPLDEEGFRVFMFGGSTTFGYGVADCETVPYYLERELRRLHPALDPVVYNFGRGWYYSTQEMVLLLTLLEEGQRPDLVVFMDGFNEGQGEPHYTDEMAALFAEHNSRDTGPIVRDLLARLPMGRFWRAVAAAPSPGSYYRMKEPSAVRDDWIAARHLVQAMGRVYGFTPYFFVQPVPGYENEFLDHKYRSEGYLEHQEHVMEKIRLMAESVDGVTSFSMTHLLRDWHEQPFVDDIHYTSAVHEHLATFIAGKLRLPE